MAFKDSSADNWNSVSAWRILSTLFSACLFTAAIAGCGGASTQHASSPRKPLATQVTQPVEPTTREGVAARVAGRVIRATTFQHVLSSEIADEPLASRLAPPEFTACISHHREASRVTVTEASVSALKAQCEKEYQTVRTQVLGRLISAVWVIGEAHELGVDATRAEVEREVHQTEFTYAAAREFLDSEAIRAVVKRKVGPITAARVARYYASHKSQFTIPEKRDLQIVRTKTRAEALGVKRQLADGGTFAHAAKAVSARYPQLQQPVYSKRGLVLGLKSGVYNEKPLNDAIFSAKPNVLVGPVDVTFNFPGSFVFEVTKIVPARQRPLADVAAALKKELPERLNQQAMVDFIKKWRTKWRARTDCNPGFVVIKCKQFRATGSAAHEDPYALA